MSRLPTTLSYSRDPPTPDPVNRFHERSPSPSEETSCIPPKPNDELNQTPEVTPLNPCCSQYMVETCILQCCATLLFGATAYLIIYLINL